MYGYGTENRQDEKSFSSYYSRLGLTFMSGLGDKFVSQILENFKPLVFWKDLLFPTPIIIIIIIITLLTVSFSHERLLMVFH